MKRSYSDMLTKLSELPGNLSEKNVFKSTLSGSHKFRIKQLVDISKPSAKQIDEIEEPEEEATAAVIKLNKSNARMIQLDLEDANQQSIRAIETERIESLTDAKPGFIISLQGPMVVRCSNIMLEKKNVVGVEIGPKEEKEPELVKEEKVLPISMSMPEEIKQEAPPVKEEIARDEQPPSKEPEKDNIQVIDIADWDEDDEEDCIILD